MGKISCQYFKDFCDPLHRFDCFHYTQLLKQAGLIPHSILEVVENDPLSSRSELRDQIKSWLPHLKILPSPLLEEQFLNEMVIAFMDSFFPGQSEPSFLTDCNVQIIGQKPHE